MVNMVVFLVLVVFVALVRLVRLALALTAPVHPRALSSSRYRTITWLSHGYQRVNYRVKRGLREGIEPRWWGSPS